MSSEWNETKLEGGIHGLTAGSGTTVVLLSGWPETAEAYSEIIPQLAGNHQVLALDPPGLGGSDPAAGGYDTATIAKILASAVRTFTPARIHLVGHDVGGWIAYAWAAQFSGAGRESDFARYRGPGHGYSAELSITA